MVIHQIQRLHLQRNIEGEQCHTNISNSHRRQTAKSVHAAMYVELGLHLARQWSTANTTFAGNITSRPLAPILQQWKFKDRLDSGKSEGSSLSYSSTRLRWYCVRLGKIRTSFYSILPHSRIVDPPKIEDEGMDVHTVRRRDTN